MQYKHHVATPSKGCNATLTDGAMEVAWHCGILVAAGVLVAAAVTVAFVAAALIAAVVAASCRIIVVIVVGCGILRFR
jgi:hypothetical protein